MDYNEFLRHVSHAPIDGAKRLHHVSSGRQCAGGEPAATLMKSWKQEKRVKGLAAELSL